jgi:hypothetical protein
MKWLACIALALACACSSHGDWTLACKAAGGHVYKQYVYKGSVWLCLTVDGRIIEIEE